MKMVRAFIASLLSFAIIDTVWIALVVRPYYESQIGHMLREPLSLTAGVVFYLMYAGAIVILAVNPAHRQGGLKRSLYHGAVLGAVAYGTYTITNYAVLSGWTTGIVLSDIAWGTFLTMISAACGYLASK